jgi:hypothetical protein
MHSHKPRPSDETAVELGKALLWVVEATPSEPTFQPLQSRWANQLLVATGLCTTQKKKKKARKSHSIAPSSNGTLIPRFSLQLIAVPKVQTKIYLLGYFQRIPDISVSSSPIQIKIR